MVSHKQCYTVPRAVTGAFVTLAILVAPAFGQASGRKFYPDDPVLREPPPRPVKDLAKRDVDYLYDFLQNSLVTPHTAAKIVRRGPHAAVDVNTLGDVPESGWYTNRHYYHRMSIEELKRGPGNSTPPAKGTWRVISAKSNGIMPGFVIEDEHKNRYLIKFDPPQYPELASAADVIGSKVFYALGYNTPENYIVHFRREDLDIRGHVTFHDAAGKRRVLTARILGEILGPQPKGKDGSYRAVASRYIAGDLVGPFSYEGMRTDDPNDIVPHEGRRELRALRVFASWLNHADTKSINTLDSIVSENGVRYLQHYLIDFGSILGSAGTDAKLPWYGHEYIVDFKGSAAQMVTFGIFAPRWQRSNYPKLTGVGRLDYESFDPVSWKSDYPNPAFLLLDGEDGFWAAKQIAAFSEADIRALVGTGEYSDRRAEDWIVRCLIARRDKVVKAYLSKFLPLDRFRVNQDRLEADDLAVRYGFACARDYAVQWYAFDNSTGPMMPLKGETTLALPRQARDESRSAYFAARIHGDDSTQAVTVYVRNNSGRMEVAGVDRSS